MPVIGAVSASHTIIKFPLDADAIAALTAQRASDMRLTVNDKNWDYSFGKNPVDKIEKAINCIL